ncbi:MAG: hypothetical protein AAF634_10085 [Bacteroidota bacterium]
MCCSSKIAIQAVPVLRASLFATILSRATCDTGMDVDCIGITASYRHYTISFYGDRKDNYALMVEDFGKLDKGKWIQFEPTTEQLNCLEQRLEAEVERIEQHIVTLEHEELRRLQEEWYYQKYGHPGALYSKFY